MRERPSLSSRMGPNSIPSEFEDRRLRHRLRPRLRRRRHLCPCLRPQPADHQQHLRCQQQRPWRRDQHRRAGARGRILGQQQRQHRHLPQPHGLQRRRALCRRVGIFNGADNYEIAFNDFCANTSSEYGGGISHFGLSPGGKIHHNRIYYNDAFDEGGGIMIGGDQVEHPTAPRTIRALDRAMSPSTPT